MEIFVLTKKLWPSLNTFWCKIWPFSLKIRFSDIFFETAHQICLKLRQKLGTIAWIIEWQCCVRENSCFIIHLLSFLQLWDWPPLFFYVFFLFSRLHETSALRACLCYFDPKKLLWPSWGHFNPPKMLRNPLRYWFLKVIRFCLKFTLWVIWWCWFHFWCYFHPKKLLWPPRGAF